MRGGSQWHGVQAVWWPDAQAVCRQYGGLMHRQCAAGAQCAVGALWGAALVAFMLSERNLVARIARDEKFEIFLPVLLPHSSAGTPVLTS